MQAHFNSRPSARGDNSAAERPEARPANFNSRPSARGDWRRCSKSPRKSTISIHAPPRGATADVQRIIAALRRFQFTPLREGRQALFSYISTQKISIHAPPRGATAWRADATPAHYFNSRPSARGDCIRRVTSSGVMDISIHAPPRGATPTSILISRQSEFQFTPLREGRRCGKLKQSTTRIFQFTPLREGRPTWTAAGTLRRLFQFTPLREGRPDMMAIADTYHISIHAPPRGATSAYNETIMEHLFQFTPLREGRRREVV